LKIKQIVVEPTVGICEVEGVRRMTIDGVEKDFYILRSGNARVMIPTDQIERRGIRAPMSAEDIKKIFAALKVPVSPSRGNTKAQYLGYREILKSGNPQKIAKLLRDLYTLEQVDELKGKERDIMEQSRKFLCDEICYVTGQSRTKVMERINQSLKSMYKKKISKERQKAKRKKEK
ncbi:MAG: hypothetical protein N2246_10045, partial [Candidatus Sumerlaeia bacterium]|nr:hypothetical protein [Candidatus Sumerlaeia bacterium]